MRCLSVRLNITYHAHVPPNVSVDTPSAPQNRCSLPGLWCHDGDDPRVEIVRATYIQLGIELDVSDLKAVGSRILVEGVLPHHHQCYIALAWKSTMSHLVRPAPITYHGLAPKNTFKPRDPLDLPDAGNLPEDHLRHINSGIAMMGGWSRCKLDPDHVNCWVPPEAGEQSDFVDDGAYTISNLPATPSSVVFTCGAIVWYTTAGAR